MDNKIDKKLDKIIKILSINEYAIIGSKGDPNIKDEVISDIDTQDIETNINYNEVLKHFQNIYNIIKKKNNIIITDFKCGYNELTERPYRWTYKTIINGYQYDEENNKIYFIDQLKKYSIIKIDTIIYYNNEYIELTMNYYFDFNNNKSYKSKNKKEILKELNEDINYYINEGNYYKALKRLNSYYRIQGKTNKKLLDIINSDEYGKKAHKKSQLETLLYIYKYHKNLDITEELNKLNVKTDKDIINKINELDKEINNSKMLKLIQSIKKQN